MQLQARRRAQASITNSPSSSLTYTQRDVRLAIVTAWRAHAAARAPGGPRAPDGRHTVARGSASRERNHRAGDHPIPFRTRQLSPASPKVLRRKAAGGQVVPLAGGAFLVYNRDTRKVSLFITLLSYHTVLSLWSFYALTGRVLKSKADCNLYVLRRVCLYVIP